MQDKDSEALRNQRRRRKRIGRIKSTIVIVLTGWVILSMLLILLLLAKTFSLEQKIDRLIQTGQTVETIKQQVSQEAETETEYEIENVAENITAGIDDADNRAEEGDVLKVYLTFDDGPSENTAKILDILAEYDVKATFFVIGKEDEESKALYQRIVEEGHTIGMHSYSNKYSQIYQSQEAFEEDYFKLRDYLFEITGVQSSYYRFPGGSSNQISNVPMTQLIQFLNGQQTTYCDWNISAGDAASTAYTADEIVENVVEDVVKYKTSVVLLHDAADKSATVDAIAPLIETLEDMGVELLPINEDTQVIQYVKADSVE